MIFETTEETDPKTGAKRVLVYEDDGVTIIMLNEKLYEGDETLKIMMIFGEDDSESDSDSFCDGPQDG